MFGPRLVDFPSIIRIDDQKEVVKRPQYLPLIPDSGIKYEQALKETLLFSKLKAIIAQRKL